MIDKRICWDCVSAEDTHN